MKGQEMIKGLTHDLDTGIPNKVTRFKGKISAGFAPKEGPNKNNYPMAAGFFRMLKQVVKTQKVSGKEVVIPMWTLNEQVQNKLEKTIDSKSPRKIDCVSMFKTPGEQWESFLGKFSNVEGLLCKSYGENAIPMELNIEGDKRERRARKFNGVAKCPYKECPDYKEGKCSERGFMKVFPLIDMSTQPYQFTTTSINTIMSIESMLDDMYNLSKAAHMVRTKETGENHPFEGLFGVNMSLIHKKKKSGGRNVFVTELIPSPEFSESMMNTIQRGIRYKSQSYLEGGTEGFSLDGDAIANENIMLESAAESMSDQDNKDIAEDFPKGKEEKSTEKDKKVDDAVREAMTK